MSNKRKLSDAVHTESDWLHSDLLNEARSRDTVYNYSNSRGSDKDSGSESAVAFFPAGESLSSLREMCDLCVGPDDDDDDLGGIVTIKNADKFPYFRFRDSAELALKLYNDTKSRNFKLVKVCKGNTDGYLYEAITFRAHEDGSEGCHLFRGVIYTLKGLVEAVFCEIKDDDEVTLLPDDDDYVSSDQSCDSKMILMAPSK